MCRHRPSAQEFLVFPTRRIVQTLQPCWRCGECVHTQIGSDGVGSACFGVIVLSEQPLRNDQFQFMVHAGEPRPLPNRSLVGHDAQNSWLSWERSQLSTRLDPTQVANDATQIPEMRCRRAGVDSAARMCAIYWAIYPNAGRLLAAGFRSSSQWGPVTTACYPLRSTHSLISVRSSIRACCSGVAASCSGLISERRDSAVLVKRHLLSLAWYADRTLVGVCSQGKRGRIFLSLKPI